MYTRTSGGPVDTGPEYHQELERELFKLKQMFGKGDMDTFPTFKFEGKSNHKLNLGDYCRQSVFMYIFFWLFMLGSHLGLCLCYTNAVTELCFIFECFWLVWVLDDNCM